MSESTTESNLNKGVFVSNIAASADQKTVNDFFSFCGKITALSLSPSANGTQESVVIFESESAAKTALLLTNAVIVDRSITVEALTAAHAPPAANSQVPPEQIQQKPFAVDDSARSKTSVVASLIAAGYSVGADALHKARDYDEKHTITQQLKAGAENIKAKANEIDEKYKITETAQAAVNKVTDTAKAVDDRFKISSTANVAISTVSATAQAATSVVAATAKSATDVVTAKVMANPTIANAVHTVQEKTAAAGAAVKSQYDALSSETASEIEKRKAAKATESAAATASAAAAGGEAAAAAAPAAAGGEAAASVDAGAATPGAAPSAPSN